MATDDSNRESKITTDPDRAESWARDLRAAPVLDGGELRFVDEGEFDEDRHNRVTWDDFETQLTESDLVVVYHEGDERDELELRHREEIVSGFEAESADERLRTGEVLSRPTSEIGASSRDVHTTTSTAEHEAMTPERVEPRDEDEGKTVVDTEGTELGVVTDVQGEQIYVEAHPGLTDKVMARFGWSDADEDDYVLGPDEITLITDDEVEVYTPEEERKT